MIFIYIFVKNEAQIVVVERFILFLCNVPVEVPMSHRGIYIYVGFLKK